MSNDIHAHIVPEHRADVPGVIVSSSVQLNELDELIFETVPVEGSVFHAVPHAQRELEKAFMRVVVEFLIEPEAFILNTLKGGELYRACRDAYEDLTLYVNKRIEDDER